MGLFDLFKKKAPAAKPAPAAPPAPPAPSAPQVMEKAMTVQEVREILKAAGSGAEARETALCLLGGLPEWYLVSERERGDKPFCEMGESFGLEGCIYSMDRIAMMEAQTLGMKKKHQRNVMFASPRGAIEMIQEMGATHIRFDRHMHDIVISISEMRRYVLS